METKLRELIHWNNETIRQYQKYIKLHKEAGERHQVFAYKARIDELLGVNKRLEKFLNEGKTANSEVCPSCGHAHISHITELYKCMNCKHEWAN